MKPPGIQPCNKSCKPRLIKCVVWDLDNTIWHGILLEDRGVVLRYDVVSIIQALDRRGILQSIASQNSERQAMARLRDFGIAEYFLYPQIGWNSKSNSIKTIAKEMNIGLEAIAFIDDDPFERDEVCYSLHQVLCINASDLTSILEMPEMNPRFITDDSINRRQMVVSDAVRRKAEETYTGPKEAFLASLGMRLTLFPAKEEDLKRAEELTIRTNQLNATGYTYSYEELNNYRISSGHKLIMAKLEDRYGSYGHIGLALVECEQEIWILKLFLMSCRVMSRGVGTIMLSHIMALARESNSRLFAEFVPNDRNRMMDITYRFSGFHEVDKKGDLIILENDLRDIQPFPDYIKVETNG